MEKQPTYRPILFIAITFAVTWICVFFIAYQVWFDYDTVLGIIILNSADFLKSASPFLTALLLWRKPLFSEHQIFRYLLGNRPKALPYAIVIFLFVFQFITFFIFRVSDSVILLTTFLSTWAGQILFGGGMEEGGWRGYLQPAFERKMHTIVSVLLVGIIWTLWHLPYFFLPGEFASGGNFIMYAITATATAFTLTAIYKLTGSILLCIMFHSWQNTIVMTIPCNMANPGFLIMFAVQTAVSIILCVKPFEIEKKGNS